MNPVGIINSAVAGIDALLNIINAIRAQGGMTDDAILAAAQSQTTANSAQIAQLLANLPPQS